MRRSSTGIFAAIAATLMVLLAAPRSARADGKRTTQASSNSVSLDDVDIDWGAGIPLFRFNVRRNENEPGRLRNYQPEISTIGSQLLFQVNFHPHGAPWQQPLSDHLGTFPAIGLTAFALADINTQRAAQSEISLGFGLTFLRDAIVLGVGFDLYRGIPVLGMGTAGGDTVPTGALGAAFATGGEFTVENFFFVINLNLVAIGRVASEH